MGLLDAFGSSSFWTEDVPNSAKGLLSFKPDTRNVLARVLMEYAKDTPNRVRENIATNFPDPNLLTPQAMQTPQGQQARNALADVLMGFAGTTTPVRGLTKFEQAHQLAQRNAALPVEQGGLGLPPNNTAMDRAKALGFTDDVYHGTNADIKGFDLSKSGSANAEQFGAGIYTATNPQTASGYANSAKEGANVLPLKVRLNNPITPETEKRLTKSQIKNIVQKSPEIDNALWNFGDIGYEGKAKVLSNAVDSFHQFQKNKLLETLHPISSDFFPKSPEQFNNALASILKKDGVKVEFGIDDALWNFGESGDKFLIPWQANQVRSRFAAFDPMRRNEADLLGNADPRLLGGIAGGGLLGSYFWPKE
jgi:hypothetical protein